MPAESVGPPIWRVGDRWVYGAELRPGRPDSHLTVTEVVAVVDEPGGPGWYEVTRSDSPNLHLHRRPGLGWFATREGGRETRVSEASGAMLPWPLASGKGSREPLTSCERGRFACERGQSVTKEVIAVPAGRFATFRVEEWSRHDLACRCAYVNTHTRRWYSPEVGNLVRSEIDCAAPSFPTVLLEFRRA